MRYSLETRSFMAHALKDLKKSYNVLSLSEKSIFHKLSLSALNFNSQMNAKKLENDQYVMYKMNLSNIPNILIMNLAYHIYNLEFSNFKPWILSLTPEISNFLTSMTAYEYNTFIKSNKEMNPFIKDYFDSFEKDWKNLDYFIKKKMTSEERQSFFNGHTFTKTDYLFAISVTERHIWPKDDEKELILFPGNDNFPRKNEEKSYEDYFKQQEVQPLGNQSMHFKFRADRNISKGDSFTKVLLNLEAICQFCFMEICQNPVIQIALIQRCFSMKIFLESARKENNCYNGLQSRASYASI